MDLPYNALIVMGFEFTGLADQLWGGGSLPFRHRFLGKIIRMAKDGDNFFHHFRHFRHNGGNGENIDGENGKNGKNGNKCSPFSPS